MHRGASISQSIHRRAGEEKGFTLIELLVVILIIGILAAIAIPSFINQRYKGQDATAKSYARSASTAEETYFSDKQRYTTTFTDLTTIEPALKNTPSDTDPTLAGNPDAADSYTISVVSKSGNTFTVARESDGTVTRTCSVPSGNNTGGCAGSSW
jgi:type IV pilus assembly protein PilA